MKERLDNLVSHPAADTLAPFVTEVVTEAMRGKSDEKITGKGTLSTKGVATTVIEAAQRVYLQGRDLTLESVFTMDNIEAVAPKRGREALIARQGRGDVPRRKSWGPGVRSGKDV